MGKHFFLKIAFGLIVASVLSKNEVSAQLTGSGTMNDPYQIATAADLEELRNTAAWKYYILVADINMVNEYFTPLSSPGVQAFQGNINGRGHVIKNLVVTPGAGQSTDVGFISKLQGHIDSLGFRNLTVETSGSTNYVGGIAGQLTSGSNFKITNSYIVGGTISGGDYVGSIAGAIWGDNAVTNCFTDAVVSGTGWRVCGLIGRNAAAISKSAFYGEVSSAINASWNRPICELWNTGTASDCYYDENIGNDEVSGDTALSSAEMLIPESYPGLDFSTPIWKIWEENYAVLDFFNPSFNSAPLANAGEDQIVVETSEVTLDGSGSLDPDEDPITFTWTAPVGITLSNTSAMHPTFTAPSVDADTDYEFILKVSDGTVDSENDIVVVTVKQNIAPVANAGDDQTVTETSVVTLDASASSDADADDLTFAWTAPEGIALSDLSIAQPTFTAPHVDTDTDYEFFLLVNDGIDDSVKDTIVVTVKQNNPPIADAGDDQTVAEGILVSLDGYNSSDPDGDPLTYNWTAPDGITLTDLSVARPKFIAPSVSERTDYTFSIIVNDGIDDSDPDEVVVTVEPETGIEDKGITGFNIYPNPSSGLIYLEAPGDARVIVTNIVGIQIRTESVSRGSNALDLSSLEEGFYFLTIGKGHDKVTKRLIMK